jgi:Zn-dependent M16 (insulinase) family peptidase
MLLFSFLRQRLIQEEKARVEREKIAAEEKAKRDVAEQAVRVVQLQETVALFRELSEKMYKMKLEKQANNEVHIITLYKQGGIYVNGLLKAKFLGVLSFPCNITQLFLGISLFKIKVWKASSSRLM